MPEKLKPGTYCGYYTPDGKEIVGSFETVTGTAMLNGLTVSEDSEQPEIEYEGTTEIDWDNQKTVRLSRKIDGVFKKVRAFVDDDGTIWPEHLLTLKPKHDDRE